MALSFLSRSHSLSQTPRIALELSLSFGNLNSLDFLAVRPGAAMSTFVSGVFLSPLGTGLGFAMPKATR